ncbi:MAG: PAS domain S-box protein [Gammaproteobacteria bacterium]|nr:PAS domain S-box protein [Gammaproteobacteria bacterium]
MRNHRPTSELIAVTRSATNLLLFLTAILAASLLFPMPGLQGVAGYLPLHTFMETVAVVTASMIFAIGWHTSTSKPDYRRLAIACLFLGVAFLDFSHILSFDGMPDYVTPGSPEKSINFWLMARIFAAAALLSAVFLPAVKPGTAVRYAMLMSVLLCVALIHIWFLYYPDNVPATYVEPGGLTTFKIAVEYGLVIAFGLAAWLLWQQSKRSGRPETLMLATSAAVMSLSEVFFAVYATVTDIYNLFGHIYKIVAYSLLYRALVVTGIEQPFREVENLNNRVRATLDALPDMMFEISEDGTIQQYHSNVSQQELLAPPEIFLGKNMSEFVPDTVMAEFRSAVADINETGRSSARQYSLMTNKGLRWYEISGSGLRALEGDLRYILVIRDVTERHTSEERAAILLNLASDALSLDEKQLATQALDKIEKITQSRIGFLHMVAEDQQEIELLAWSSATEKNYCNAHYNNHYPVSEAGIWADCVRERRPIVVNNYAAAKNKKGLPDGHSSLERFVSIPVFDNNKIRMIVGVGNSDYDYNAETVSTVQLIGNELYQIIQRRRAQREHERTQRILKAALDHLPVGIAVNSVGDEVHFEYMNDNFPAFYRTTREALKANPDFWQVVYEDPEQRELIKKRIVDDFASGDPDRMRWEAVPIPKEGEELRYVTAQNVQVPEEGLSVSLVMDITERLKAEVESKIAATAFSSQEGIMITDANKKILRVNNAFERTTGYTQEEAMGKDPSFFGSGKHDKAFYRDMWESIKTTGSWRGEIWNKRKNGEIYPQSLTISAVKNADGEITNYVGDFIDISDLKNAESKISRLSFYDALTGLPNRVQLQTLINDSLDYCVQKRSLSALLIIDLDYFKLLNDTMGHDAGDYLLVLVSDRLRSTLGKKDYLARYGGAGCSGG